MMLVSLAVAVVLGLAGLVLLVGVVWWVSTLNDLIRRRNAIQNATSVLDACLKRRYDLVPDLVESVKRHMAHEKDLVDSVTKARKTVMGARGAGDPAAEAAMGDILKAFNVMVENYPDSHADQTVDTLMRSLSEIEEEIRAGRQMLAGNTTMYNNLVQGVPSGMVASVHGFATAAMFSIPEEQREKTPAWK
ncbi:MAG TPA: LemA family protein [Armatimonadota bacterium]|jgi:LemA protein